MTPVAKTAGVAACPNCLTISADDRQPCGVCRLPRDWLERVPALRAALSPAGKSWNCQCRLDARWDGRKAELDFAVPGGLELPLQTGDATIGFELSEAAGPLIVRRGDVVLRMPLPGERVLEGLILQGRVAASASRAPQVSPIGAFLPGAVSLNEASEITLGRKNSGPGTVQIPHPDAELAHCVIARQPETRSYWIADQDSRCGTFVNRQPILARRLHAGDLVQIGPYAWVFSEEDGFLVPVCGIDGVRLQLQGVGLGDRLRDVNLDIAPGEFVAIVGPSGAGKSTLLRAILGAPRSRDRGAVLANGRDIAEHRQWYRSLLGYVSQKPVVHEALQAERVVEFSAWLRSGRAQGVKQLLRQVDLPQSRWVARLSELSGGEAGRVRTAVELVTQPRLLLLDEPTSGLDDERELRVLNLLRSLSYQGCTVFVVTHTTGRLDLFDRVLKVDGEQPGQVLDATPAGPPPPVQPAQAGADTEPAAARGVCAWKQFTISLVRELALACSDWRQRLLLPVLVVPLLFALSLSLSVPAHDRPLLGFLAVLSSIWMGASLSLMSIVNEREVLEHERLLFLRLRSYLLAKTTVLWFLSALQTVGFVLLLWLLLWLLRGSAEEAGMLYGPPWVAACLIPVGWAAVGLGLLISAAVRDNKSAANFILPLVMILQIVFSVQVAGRGDAPLHQAYGEFHLHACAGAAGCPRRAEVWIPRRRDSQPSAPQGWLCLACRDEWNKWHVDWQERDQDENGGQGHQMRRILSQRRNLSDPQTRERDAFENDKRPPRAASAISYFSLSRYGDIALSSFAYRQEDFQAQRGRATNQRTASNVYGYAAWRQGALAVLFCLAVGLPLLTGIVLGGQTAEGRSARIGRLGRGASPAVQHKENGRLR